MPLSAKEGDESLGSTKNSGHDNSESQSLIKTGNEPRERDQGGVTSGASKSIHAFIQTGMLETQKLCPQAGVLVFNKFIILRYLEIYPITQG
jgi:hypothetical protein